MLAGLAAQTRRPDAVFVVDNACDRPHPGGARGARDRPGRCASTWSTRGEHSAARAASTSASGSAYDAGYDRIWLMDDDVVPAPDCLATLMATDGTA